jgi:hypothetical protein
MELSLKQQKQNKYKGELETLMLQKQQTKLHEHISIPHHEISLNKRLVEGMLIEDSPEKEAKMHELPILHKYK